MELCQESRALLRQCCLFQALIEVTFTYLFASSLASSYYYVFPKPRLWQEWCCWSCWDCLQLIGYISMYRMNLILRALRSWSKKDQQTSATKTRTTADSDSSDNDLDIIQLNSIDMAQVKSYNYHKKRSHCQGLRKERFHYMVNIL